VRSMVIVIPEFFPDSPAGEERKNVWDLTYLILLKLYERLLFIDTYWIPDKFLRFIPFQNLQNSIAAINNKAIKNIHLLLDGIINFERDSAPKFSGMTKIEKF